MDQVSTMRMYLLRALYLLITVGLALMIWPGLLNPPANLSHMAGVVRSVLGAVSLLALLGIRYPLKMLPLLFFELVWKTIWILAFGIPLWSSGRLDADTRQTFFNCLMGVVLVGLALPWGFVYRSYVKAPSERWRRARAGGTAETAARGGAIRMP